MEQSEFEKQILKEIHSMSENFTASLSSINQALTALEGRMNVSLEDLGGKIKGNHELITLKLNSYVDHDKCEAHRQRQGERSGDFEQRMKIVESDMLMIRSDFNEFKASVEKNAEGNKNTMIDIIISWGPGLIKFFGLVGIIAFLVMGEHLQF